MKCASCGESAKGYAMIGADRYCHEGESPTCYEKTGRCTADDLDSIIEGLFTDAGLQPGGEAW